MSEGLDMVSRLVGDSSELKTSLKDMPAMLRALGVRRCKPLFGEITWQFLSDASNESFHKLHQRGVPASELKALRALAHGIQCRHPQEL